MRVALVQYDIKWEAKSANLDLLSNKIRSETADIFILPEMFQTGFSMNANALSEPMDGQTVNWMRSLAVEKNSAICGSIIIRENESHYNRFVFCTPDGETFTYDKRHLFTLAGENDSYQKGSEKMIFNYKGWRICPQICYDLRFPVFSRNTEDYDLLIYVANWPAPRIAAWDILLAARAVENMSYVVGVNRIGIDGNGHPYPGRTKVFDCLGNAVADGQSLDSIVTAELNRNEMLAIRSKLNFLADRDNFTVN